jgi:hypothetical protein
VEQMLIVDGGVLVNLYVTRLSWTILSTYPLPCAATRVGLAEQVPVWDQPDTTITLAANLDALGACIVILDPGAGGTSTGHSASAQADAERFLEWSALVPDKLAHVLVHADRGGHHVASDDPCVRAAIRELAPHLRLLATEDLVWRWYITAHPSSEHVQEVLSAIEVVGCYTPTAETPTADWWRNTIRAP